MKILMVVLMVAVASSSAAGADLPGWMAGSWAAKIDGIAMEEHWTTAAGGLMVGMHRDIGASGRPQFEFVRIEKRGDDLFYIAQPGGRAPTEFKMISVSKDKIVFSNPLHDFPKNIIYWRRKNGSLCARVEGTMNGKEMPMEWCWKRVGK